MQVRSNVAVGVTKHLGGSGVLVPQNSNGFKTCARLYTRYHNVADFATTSTQKWSGSGVNYWGHTEITRLDPSHSRNSKRQSCTFSNERSGTRNTYGRNMDGSTPTAVAYIQNTVGTIYALVPTQPVVYTTLLLQPHNATRPSRLRRAMAKCVSSTTMWFDRNKQACTASLLGF